MNPLTNLRDIHLPGEVPLWPPAPGWWVLGAMLVAVGWFLFRYFRAPSRRARRWALKELGRLEQAFHQDQDARALLRAVPQLVRRYALGCFPREEVAGLEGKRWLEFLDRSGATKAFSDGPGEVLAVAPYQPGPEVDTLGLLAVTREWIARCPAAGSGDA